MAEGVQQRAHRQIAGVVSRCLTAVFDRPYSFRIAFEKKRGRTEAVLRFTRREKGVGRVDVDPADGAGGGVLDVAAFALRLACLMLTRPRPRRVLFLDEPFRHVSRNYRDRVRQLLETLSREMELQIIFITHDQELVAGRLIELK